MADRPILFSGPMVRALLAGTKTQTRRLFKPRGFEFYTHPVSGDRYNQYSPYRDGTWDKSRIVGSGRMEAFGWGESLYGYLAHAPGDRLYVRETWTHTGTGVWTIADTHRALDGAVAYQADGAILGGKYWPSIHMPRRYSRITLTVTYVRVERLQDISEADALAEGMTQATADAIMSTDELQVYATTHIVAPQARGRILYETIWDQINGDGSWSLNPWVAAYTFTVQQGNIDAPA